MNNPERFNYKIGDKLIHWSVGMRVKGVVTKITGNCLTTEHKPVKWGNDTFAGTHIIIDDTGKGTPYIIKRL